MQPFHRQAFLIVKNHTGCYRIQTIIPVIWVVITAPVISDDYRSGADDILRRAKHGRTRLGLYPGGALDDIFHRHTEPGPRLPRRRDCPSSTCTTYSRILNSIITSACGPSPMAAFELPRMPVSRTELPASAPAQRKDHCLPVSFPVSDNSPSQVAPPRWPGKCDSCVIRDILPCGIKFGLYLPTICADNCRPAEAPRSRPANPQAP